MKSKNLFLALLILLLVFAIYQIYDLNNRVKLLESENKTVADTSMVVNANQTQPTTMEAVPVSTKNAGEPENLTIRLFENSAPSVTFITTTALQRDFWTRNVTEIPGGTGSGFIWDEEGHIVTNYHVIKGANKAMVTLANNNSYQAKLIGVAPEKDLAVLKIDAPEEELIPIPVGKSYNLKVGQNVFAIGNPFGLDQTLTTGIISALGREIESQAQIPIRDVIQTDAAINPGNSGGPLLDSGGKLIGVNTAIYSPSGAYAGIGFSIPVDVVKWVVPDLIEYGEVKRPLIGIEMVSTQLLNRMGLKGAMVLNVVPGSPAEKAGLLPTKRNQKGDLIVGLNDEPINENLDLVLGLEKYKPGDHITLQVERNGKSMEIEIVLDVQN
jgi:S1-C subfamily serine protease